jgi:hypothetical protein
VSSCFYRERNADWHHPDGAQNQTYNFTESGIAWSGIAKNYATTPGYASPTDVLPPPNWALMYPNGYTDGFPNLHDDEHFQVWMRVAALPTFRKLWARNDEEIMTRGTYRIVAYMSERVPHFQRDVTDSFRLPGKTVLWHKIHRHLYCFVDRRQATILGVGVHCCRCSMCGARIGWACSPPHQAEEAWRHES